MGPPGFYGETGEPGREGEIGMDIPNQRINMQLFSTLLFKPLATGSFEQETWKTSQQDIYHHYHIYTEPMTITLSGGG